MRREEGQPSFGDKGMEPLYKRYCLLLQLCVHAKVGHPVDIAYSAGEKRDSQALEIRECGSLLSPDWNRLEHAALGWTGGLMNIIKNVT